MNKKIPRGKTPSLIGGSNGKPSKVSIKGQSNCYRCKVSLIKGTRCMEIPQLGSGFTKKRRVCHGCFAKVLQQTRVDLEELEGLLPK